MQCPHTVLELRDQVLLIAAVIRLENNVGGRKVAVVGDVEEIPDIVEQHGLTSLDREILAEYYHAVVGVAGVGPVRKLRDVLRAKPNVFIAAVANKLLLEPVVSGRKLAPPRLP